MDVLIVGAGDVGRWFGGLVDGPPAFADVDREQAEAAAAAAGPRARAVDLDGDESFGLVCVAVPLSAASAVIEAQASRAQQAVVDLTGAMAAPLAAMARTAPARERVSFHPLFAPEHAPGRVAVSTSAGGPATDRVRGWLEAAGNDLVEVDPETHDDAMVTVQGRAHAAILAFALAADDVPEGLETPVYEDLRALADRVTDGSPGVYADIQSAFGGAADVAAAAERIAQSDGDEFAALYEDAGR